MKRIYIEITNVCNLNCSFCINDNKDARFLDVASFSHIVNEIKEYTDYIYLHVLGEPLMHLDLDKIIKIANRNNLNVQITTNGTLLKERQDILLNNKIRQINISVHAFYEIGNNTKYLDDILSVGDVLSDNTYISYRLWCLNNHILNADYQKIYEYIMRHYDKDIANNYHNITLAPRRFLHFDEVFKWPSLNDEVIDTSGTCRALSDHLAILSNGEVVACCMDAYGKTSLGNIFKESFKDIINSPKAKKMQKGFKDNKLVHPLCQRCNYRKLKFD